MSSAKSQERALKFQASKVELQEQNQELALAISRYETFFDKSTIGYVTLAQDGKVQFINHAALILFNCTQEEILGATLTQHIHPSSQTVYTQYLTSLANAKTPKISWLTLNSPDENTIEIECRGSVGVINGKTEFCLALHDISEHKHSEKKLFDLIQQLEVDIRKKTEFLTKTNQDLKDTIDQLNYSKRQLLEREAKHNSILNASIEGIIVIDPVGRIVSANAAVEKIFGYSTVELIGCSISLLMPVAMWKKKDAYLEKYLNVFIPKVIGQIREVEGLRKDGSLVPLDMTIAEFPLDGMQYYSGIVRDVSARKSQELQEKEHLEKLAHVTRLGLMGEMASGIAHEVNQPLSAVVNYTQVCLHFLQTESPDLANIADIMRKANQQALRAGQIIHSMREFVKPRKIHRSTVDINDLIYDAIGLFEADFKQNLIAMRFELTKGLPDVFIDRVQIEQVIVNLIRNSIDALKDLPQFTQRQLSIETSLNHLNYIVVRVKDNGPGLTDIQQEKILTPFFTTKSSGMGMGLSISRSLVEAHHGTLHFNSKEDKGTTFYFTLPTENSANDRNKS